jgi:uncharacterized protein involved in exopolysaccharide biosynthesis
LNAPRDALVLAQPQGQPYAGQQPSGAGQQAGEEGAGLSLQQILAIVHAHRRFSLMLFAGFMVLAVVVIKLLPRTYTATSTLIIDYQVSDPLAGKEFPIALLGSYLSTQLEVIRGPDVLDPVIQSLALDKEKEFAAGFSPKNGTLQNWVRDQLRKSLTLEVGQAGSQLIHLTVASRAPDRAAQIANAIASQYVDQQAGRLTGPAAQSAGRYSEQIKSLAGRIADLEQQIDDVRRGTGLTELSPTQADSESGALTNLEGRYLEAQNLRRTAEVRLGADSAAGRNMRDSGNVQDLRAQLDKLNQQMGQLRAIYGTSHPRVLEVQGQIAATQRSLDEAVSSHVSGSSVELDAARDLEAKLKVAMDEQRAKLLRVRRVQDQSAKLFLDLESARTAYKAALEEYNRTQVASRGQYSNVNILARAEQPVRPTSPKSMKLLALAVFAGGLASLALPFVQDIFFRRRVRCRDDVQKSLRVPLLAELPGQVEGTA